MAVSHKGRHYFVFVLLWVLDGNRAPIVFNRYFIIEK